jgi:thiopurine S-methyltransferase
MKIDWLTSWESGHIPFHLKTVNSMLEKYWPKLAISPSSNIFVPLCGKSLDLLWLANQGYKVIGVELSEIACKSFFIENELAYKTKTQDEFICYYNDQIEIYCGDFFALTPEMLPSIHAVYDRAALVALPKKLRQPYADHLIKLTATQSKILLIALDSKDEVVAPPYPLTHQQIKTLFEKKFLVEEWLHYPIVDIPDELQKKGYSEIYHTVYGLMSR